MIRGRGVLAHPDPASDEHLFEEGNSRMTHVTASAVPPQSPDAIEPNQDPFVAIPHRSRKYPDAVIMVSPEDVERVSGLRWSPVRSGVRCRAEFFALARLNDGTTEYLHRFILGLSDYRVKVESINQNGLDCRRSNLRSVSAQEAAITRRSDRTSTSHYKGVSWFDIRSKWRASIGYNGRNHHLGLFADEVDAARAYDAKARELFGDIARLNFPDLIREEAA